MQGDPRVANVVPAEILNGCTLKRVSPGLCIGIRKRLPSVRKYPLWMLAQLPAQHLQRGRDMNSRDVRAEFR